MSDLDLDQLVHTAEGRLVLEVLQGRRLPLLIVMQDKGEVVLWYPPTVIGNLLADNERMLDWTRILEEHVARLQEGIPKQ